MKKYYAGIGSRETPIKLQTEIDKIVNLLNNHNYILRSGGAVGADSMFEKNAIMKEIFLPWKEYNGNKSLLFNDNIIGWDMAKKYHPAWNNLTHGAKKMMVRNCYQILGYDLNTPVDFVVCWTKGGKLKGGTAMAMRIAMDLNIPIYNLYNDNIYEEIYKKLNTISLF